MNDLELRTSDMRHNKEAMVATSHRGILKSIGNLLHRIDLHATPSHSDEQHPPFSPSSPHLSTIGCKGY